MRYRIRLTAITITGVLALAPLAACGQNGEGSDQAGSEKSSSSESSSSDKSEGDKSDSSESEDGGQSAQSMTLTGTVSNGVEAGCMMLKFEGVKYQLVGDKTKKLKDGAKVKVTGKVSEKTMSTCMEGKPFEVQTVKSA